MVRYLCNFAKSGDPNCGDAVPAWQPAGKDQKQVIRLGEGATAMGNPAMLKMIYTMLTNKAVGE